MATKETITAIEEGKIEEFRSEFQALCEKHGIGAIVIGARSEAMNGKSRGRTFKSIRKRMGLGRLQKRSSGKGGKRRSLLGFLGGKTGGKMTM